MVNSVLSLGKCPLIKCCHVSCSSPPVAPEAPVCENGTAFAAGMLLIRWRLAVVSGLVAKKYRATNVDGALQIASITRSIGANGASAMMSPRGDVLGHARINLCLLSTAVVASFANESRWYSFRRLVDGHYESLKDWSVSLTQDGRWSLPHPMLFYWAVTITVHRLLFLPHRVAVRYLPQKKEKGMTPLGIKAGPLGSELGVLQASISGLRSVNSVSVHERFPSVLI
ncbi:unnamed protein product [Soboliphyme baturini]|uniref:Uncharacterized protein n=1 Tax=Soboliphyme baturini TaxID=241478 RepID=A0A183IAU1_9BILA|nr:unnamed protein product [Soboliphyme baturini]